MWELSAAKIACNNGSIQWSSLPSRFCGIVNQFRWIVVVTFLQILSATWSNNVEFEFSILMSETFALEVQSPFSGLILSGEKSIETRAYPLPNYLHGVGILLCESSSGEDCVSCVGDNVTEAQVGLSLVGEVFFSDSKEYHTNVEWDIDREKHQVPKYSKYEWAPTETGIRYGWRIERVIVYTPPLPVPQMKRRLVKLYFHSLCRNIC